MADSNRQFILDILDHAPETERFRIVRDGTNSKAERVPKTFDLKERAEEFGLPLIEDEKFLALCQYDVMTDQLAFLVDRK